MIEIRIVDQSCSRPLLCSEHHLMPDGLKTGRHAPTPAKKISYTHAGILIAINLGVKYLTPEPKANVIKLLKGRR